MACAKAVVVVAVLICSLGAGLEIRVDRPSSTALTPRQLLRVRGGAQPALADSAVKVPLARSPSRKPRTRTKKRTPSGFGVRDAVTAALCLSYLGAAQLGSGHLMATMPTQGSQSVAWMLFGGVLSAGLYILVAVLNRARALQAGDPICRLILGVDTSRQSFARTASPPAVLFVIGSLAAMQTLPSAAGWSVNATNPASRLEMLLTCCEPILFCATDSARR